jgi:chloramphenicol-sensitive protein RarD
VSPADRPLSERFGAGLGFAIAAYGLWGLMPVYFLLLAPAGAFEIVALRVLLAVVVCVILLTVLRAWPTFLAIARDGRVVLVMFAAGILIAVNWVVYVFATTSGHVVEAALGYFINPIITVLLGVLIQRERLRPLQWAAVGVSTIAVVVLVIGYGAFPWIAFLLAASFGSYGLIKKRVADRVDALSGLTLETVLLSPFAIVALIVIASTTGIETGTVSTGQTVAAAFAGVVTAAPLLLFASATRRLSLTYVGLTQYLTPILQFLVGVVLLHEEMPPARWAGFAIVWVALIILTIDVLRAGRPPRQLVAEPT